MKIDIEKCLEFLRKTAEPFAASKADMIFQTEKRKTVKADLMQRSVEKTESAKESWAYSHPEYQTVLESLRDSVYEYELLRVQILACELKIEVWRSLETTNRMLDKVHV
jgi:hypothetical protein